MLVYWILLSSVNAAITQTHELVWIISTDAVISFLSFLFE